jgi:hypothetical protein
MSEREYFSLKYAVPGFTLILIVGAINYIPLFRIFGEPSARGIPDLFLAVLTLFSGSALGFLVSQIWWFRFAKYERHKFYEKFAHILKNKYNVAINDETKVITVFDHVVHHKEGKELSALASRRWDLYHLLSAIRISLLIGIVLGVIGRVYYEFAVGFQLSLENAFHSGELLVLVIVLSSVIVLWILLDKLRQITKEEYERLAKIRIFYSPITREQLGKVLTADYYDFGNNFEQKVIDKLEKTGITAFDVKEQDSDELSSLTGIEKEEINKLKKAVNAFLVEPKH